MLQKMEYPVVSKTLLLVCFFFVSFFLFFLNAMAATYYGVSNTVANIRTGPGTGYSILGQTALGSTYSVTDATMKPNEAGCNTGWFQISYNGKNGYVCGEFLDVYEQGSNSSGGVATSACEKEMDAKGFPSTYWGALCSLKSRYPNWEFTAQKTGIDFSTAVSAESGCGTNLMATSNPYYLNTSCSRTDYSGYKTITSGVVAYYLDPRNFLNDQQIFMFLSEYYSDKISDANYLNAIRSIFGSNNFVLQSIPDIPNYILTASKEMGVNPITIASRSRQELGDGKATSGAYKGQLQSALSGNYFDRFGLYNGMNFNNFYNFFNIGAYDSCGNMTECALVYAYRNGWGGQNYTQPEARQIAMTGGARFIKNRYVSAGQDTAYLHKFNVKPVNASSRYLNQYMTNILAPQSESSFIYKAYKSLNLLNSNFNFLIPVFDNMPASTVLPTSEATKEYNPNNKPINPGTGDESNDNKQDENKMTVNQILAAAGYKRVDNYITSIAVNTNVSDFINKIQALNAMVEVKDLNGTVVKGGVLGTGFSIKISASNTETLSIVIYGDTSGDGKINALDLLKIQKNILGTGKLSGAQLKAADPSKDGKVNALDLLKVQKNILGTGSIDQ